MSATRTHDPIRRLPPPAEVHAHIGRLLRELRLARRLYRLSRTAAEQAGTARKAVAGAR